MQLDVRCAWCSVRFRRASGWDRVRTHTKVAPKGRAVLSVQRAYSDAVHVQNMVAVGGRSRPARWNPFPVPRWKYGVGLNAIDGGNGCREGRRDPRHSPAGCGGGRCASPAVMVLRVAMTGWPRTVPIGAVNSPCTAAGMAREATECQSLRQVNGPTACVVQRFLKVGHRGKGCCNPSFRFCCPAAVG